MTEVSRAKVPGSLSRACQSDMQHAMGRVKVPGQFITPLPMLFEKDSLARHSNEVL